MKITRLLLGLFLISILASSCRVFNPSVMMRTPSDYPYSSGVDTLPEEYIIQAGDRITFQLFSNQGFKIIDLTTLSQNGGNGAMNFNNRNQFDYLIEKDSLINLPIVGRVKLAGLDLKQAEIFLEDKFSNYYNDPYVMLNVNNRRVIVFPGSGGGAQVVPIVNEYTSVIEALAQVGGIADRGRAKRVKLIRGDFANPQVYKIDLSTAEGFAEARTYYVRSNDIIYVEPSYRPVNQILTSTAQVLSLFTGILVSVNFLTNSLN